MKTQRIRLVIGAVAFGIALYVFWLLLRGPFFTNEFLAPLEMTSALIAFIPSTFTAVWGLSPLLND
ncbi:hypothetical protein [Haladaptatus sp. ZSTT2]|uniref:hypothetical protein n=1 Tax=Haladaptatus sp. ZSTT2 TaxID=3120515 RepID=UPI00300EC9B1